MYLADSTSTEGATAVQQAVQEIPHGKVSLHPAQVLKKLAAMPHHGNRTLPYKHPYM